MGSDGLCTDCTMLTVDGTWRVFQAPETRYSRQRPSSLFPLRNKTHTVSAEENTFPTKHVAPASPPQVANNMLPSRTSASKRSSKQSFPWAWEAYFNFSRYPLPQWLVHRSVSEPHPASKVPTSRAELILRIIMYGLLVLGGTILYLHT